MSNTAVIHPDPGDEFYFQEGCHILEILNREWDPAVSIARARVAPGVRTTPHCLQGTVERYVILEGSGEVEVCERAPQKVRVGDAVFIPAATRQCITNTGESDLVFLAICTPRFRPQNYVELEPAAQIPGRPTSDV